jgi:DNA polymerase
MSTSLIFYDFEVFKKDFLVVLYEVPANTRTHICNDVKALNKFYEEHKNDIWIGFNSRKYDQWILRAILGGFDPYEMNDWLINKGKDGYLFNPALSNIKVYNYDVYKGLIDYSLKTLEGFMGHDIKETSVDFRIDRKLTPDEIAETFKYCDNDVNELIQVFLQRKDEFDTRINMIKEFDLSLDYINKTSAQLISTILGASKKEINDEFDINVPDTLNLSKYSFIKDWFLNAYNNTKKELENDYKGAVDFLNTGVGSHKAISDMKELVNEYKYDYDKLFAKYFYNRSLKVDVAGVEHTFAWGGVHGAIAKLNYTCKKDELLIMADVSSLYPSIMLQYDLQSRAIKDKSIYKKIYDLNIQLKKNKDPRRPIYKLICNTTYGCMGDKFNNLYDKRNQNLVCVYGQLLLLDLIEKLELSGAAKLIQSNTDGILILIKRKDFELIDDIIYEWESRTRLSMEFTCAKKIVQKDVNNYILVPLGELYDKKGKPRWKSKGAYVKKLSELDYDLPIVNEAMVNYLVKGVPVEDTINNCNELIKFQKIYKLSGKYDYVLHNDIKYYWKSYRVFASKRIFEDRAIYKCKGNKCDKFASTPDSCFIENGNIVDKKVPEYLDKSWYIQLTKERLRQFNM